MSAAEALQKKPMDENKGSQDQKRSAAHSGGGKKRGKTSQKNCSEPTLTNNYTT
jgi:hypothetical protein